MNAYQFAARHPEQVCALIIEDIGVELSSDLPPTLHWAGTFARCEELEKQIGSRMLPYLKDSFRHTTNGWKLAFEPAEMILSQASMAGDRWADWLGSSCPALLIRGTDSRVTTAAHCEDMAARRANTRLCTLAGGHVVHDDDLAAFATALTSFLALLP